MPVTTPIGGEAELAQVPPPVDADSNSSGGALDLTTAPAPLWLIATKTPSRPVVISRQCISVLVRPARLLIFVGDAVDPPPRNPCETSQGPSPRPNASRAAVGVEQALLYAPSPLPLSHSGGLHASFNAQRSCPEIGARRRRRDAHLVGGVTAELLDRLGPARAI